jgi:uncharacterized membrane protein
MIDTKARSLIKTISWRLTGTGSTFLIAWLITGNFFIAGPIAMAQLIANTILYYIHERIWSKINWGYKSL